MTDAAYVDKNGVWHGLWSKWSWFVAHCGHARDVPITTRDNAPLTCVTCLAWSLRAAHDR